MHAPEPGAAAELEHRLRVEVAPADGRRRADDLVEERLRGGIALERRVLAALLVVEHEAERDPRSAGPARVGRRRAVADEIARRSSRRHRPEDARLRRARARARARSRRARRAPPRCARRGTARAPAGARGSSRPRASRSGVRIERTRPSDGWSCSTTSSRAHGLRVGERLLDRVHARRRHAGRDERLDPLVAPSARRKASSSIGSSSSRCSLRPAIVAKRSSSLQLGPADHVAERAPRNSASPRRRRTSRRRPRSSGTARSTGARELARRGGT